MMRPSVLLLTTSTALLPLFGCNAILGLDEGALGGGGHGGGAIETRGATTGPTTTSAESATTSGTSSGKSPPTTTATAATATSAASGSACILDEGIANGTFVSWSQFGPGSWSLAGNLTNESELQQIDPVEGGMRMIVSGASRPTDYASIWQIEVLSETYFNCVEVRGASRKTSGTGHLWAEVTFGGRKLDVEMPIGDALAPFAKACRLPAAIDDYYLRVIADQMPGDAGTPGGMVVEIDHLAFDHVCCDGVTEDCLVAD